MIRRAGEADIPAIVAMGREFFGKAWGHGYDDDATADFVRAMINGAGAVFISDAGMIGGVLSPIYCAPTRAHAVELFWWSRDGRGVELLAAFEEWAAAMGAESVRMSVINGFSGKAPAKLLAAGYRPVETSYDKAVS